MVEYTDEKISLVNRLLCSEYPETPFENQLLQRLPTDLRRLSISRLCFIQHIESLVHKKKIHQSTFNRDIIQLTQMFDNI